MTISSATIAITRSTLLSSYTYTIGSTELPITFGDYSYTPSCLGYSFAYTATLVDGTALPSYVTFTPSSKKFLIYSCSLSDAGTINIIVTGTLSDSASTADSTLTFALTLSTPTVTITRSSLSSSYSYSIGSATKPITFDDYSFAPSCFSYTFSYTAK